MYGATERGEALRCDATLVSPLDTQGRRHAARQRACWRNAGATVTVPPPADLDCQHQEALWTGTGGFRDTFLSLACQPVQDLNAPQRHSRRSRSHRMCPNSHDLVQ